ncbi:MAG: HAD-superfamily hydrolase [Erysipelotrichaceae bacterium]|nr:MAG: HAD-superfamily [Erysipelotrichaceae bacterium]TXT19817.1 MAG: HAD-superfamily hydrolase [Erysipelotrichaceae bacterium]
MSNKASYTREHSKYFQILASDYDGTLRRNGVIDPRDLESVAKFRQAGHLFGIITSRAYNMITNELNHYKLVVDFLICNNGSIIYDASGNSLYHITIDFQLAMDLIAWLEKEDAALFGVTGDKSYFAQVNPGFIKQPSVSAIIQPMVSMKEEMLKSQKITAFLTRKNNLKLTIDLSNRIEATFEPRFGLHQNRGTIDKPIRYIQINCDQCLSRNLSPSTHQCHWR